MSHLAISYKQGLRFAAARSRHCWLWEQELIKKNGEQLALLRSMGSQQEADMADQQAHLQASHDGRIAELQAELYRLTEDHETSQACAHVCRRKTVDELL